MKKLIKSYPLTHKWKLAENSECPCVSPNPTMKHLLTDCRLGPVCIVKGLLNLLKVPLRPFRRYFFHHCAYRPEILGIFLIILFGPKELFSVQVQIIVGRAFIGVISLPMA